MESQRVIFINIHYQVGEREKADRLARTYEKRGYSREADNQEDDEDLVIQLLKTKTKEM